MKLKIPFIEKLGRTWTLVILGMAVAGFFGGSLLAGLLLSGGSQSDQPTPEQETIEQVKQAGVYADNKSSLEKLEQLSPSETQVQDVLKLYREKIAEAQARSKQVETEQQRLDLQRQDLERLAQDLQQETTRLESAAKRIRQAKAELEQTRMQYTQQERVAARKQAAMFEGMQADQAAENLTNCYKAGNIKQTLLILDSMDTKKAGRAIAEIQDPKLVALLIEKLPKLKLLQQEAEAGP
ncbi:MAG: hypothetical protein ACLFUJ_14500 [Phycisphaerae bacterium]